MRGIRRNQNVPKSVSPSPAPCPPVDVINSVDCDNNTVSIYWSPVPGAVKYTATLEQVSGGTTCCTSSGTSCDITTLPCGEMYVLLVTAEGRTCNSTQSEGKMSRTGMIQDISHIQKHTQSHFREEWEQKIK